MSNTVAAAADDIPTDVMIEILARVPVESLLRFKSVRKSWYSLIHSPPFIAKHLRYASTIEQSHIAIVRHRVPDSYRLAISLLPDKTDSSVTDLCLDNPVPIPFFDELHHKLGKISVLFCGPCNGVICAYGDHVPYNKHRQGGVIYTVDPNADNEHMRGDLISLWNPATREMKRLPFSNTPRCGEDRSSNIAIGFGFDSGAKDYKVVKILDFRNEALPVVEVYNLSTNLWRKIDAVQPTFRRSCLTSSVSLDGFCYWYAGGAYDPHDGTSAYRTILSFDFVNEVFGALPLPNTLIAGENADTLLKYRESLAIIAHGTTDLHRSSTSLWVLEKDGNTSTWSKLLEVMNPNLDILGILRNEVALTRTRQYDDANATLIYQMIWYDLKSQQVLLSYGDDVIDYHYRGRNLVNYVESLVTFKESNEFDERWKLLKRDLNEDMERLVLRVVPAQQNQRRVSKKKKNKRKKNK